MGTYFVCRNCSYPPETACMFMYSSSAFPENIMKKLACPMGRKPNWKYVDRPASRKTNPKIPTPHEISKCFSQEDMEKGLSLIDFFIQQGRIYEKGDWVFPPSKSKEDEE